ncbi:Imm50 family immunity protein [Kosakonia sp. BYX6]|uniref:Imm50 family immunity protein n=1 Tax=Kosakonia calanthes TaxID=3139408 RepID=A0ABZ3B5F4_9ENTR
MWFDTAHGKEKIKFMFNNELALDNIEFESFQFYDQSKVRLCFNSRNIPSRVPEKWKINNFNGLSITLSFIGLIQFDMVGSRIGFECSPIIENTGDVIFAKIEDERKNFRLSLSAEVMVIDSIEPYLDQRWK